MGPELLRRRSWWGRKNFEQWGRNKFAESRQAITGLRQYGYSWADIALRLGITRQGAQQRWGGENP